MKNKLILTFSLSVHNLQLQVHSFAIFNNFMVHWNSSILVAEIIEERGKYINDRKLFQQNRRSKRWIIY